MAFEYDVIAKVSSKKSACRSQPDSFFYDGTEHRKLVLPCIQRDTIKIRRTVTIRTMLRNKVVNFRLCAGFPIGIAAEIDNNPRKGSAGLQIRSEYATTDELTTHLKYMSRS